MSTPGEARAIVAKAEDRVRGAWRVVPPAVRVELRGVVAELVTALDALANADALLDFALRERAYAVAAVHEDGA